MQVDETSAESSLLALLTSVVELERHHHTPTSAVMEMPNVVLAAYSSLHSTGINVPVECAARCHLTCGCLLLFCVLCR